MPNSAQISLNNSKSKKKAETRSVAPSCDWKKNYFCITRPGLEIQIKEKEKKRKNYKYCGNFGIFFIKMCVNCDLCQINYAYNYIYIVSRRISVFAFPSIIVFMNK